MDLFSDEEAKALLGSFQAIPLTDLLAAARELRAGAAAISYSRKVFIPLTRLCRDTCGYCTFAKTPSQLKDLYLSPEQVLEIARAGEAAGCHEALFTLGDKPELRYSAARSALARLGHESTVDYLESMCRLVLQNTRLLPHVNAGIMTESEIARLRRVSVSQGLMLETISDRLTERGGPHFGCADKAPAARVEMIAAAGRLSVPFTTGILIGIGETRLERIQSLLALRTMNELYGNIQEIIVQNFRAKPNTRLATTQEPDLDDLLWTTAAARIIFGSDMNIQVPPNLSYDDFPRLLDAGINDWGGISPVTPDHVNPEAPWPQISRLERATSDAGLHLQQRLAIYPSFIETAPKWLDATLRSKVLRAVDAGGFVRDEWWPGSRTPLPVFAGTFIPSQKQAIDKSINSAAAGNRLSEAQVFELFSTRGSGVDSICLAADTLRAKASGDVVRYVVNRNINYTNVCSYRCSFCAFSKGKTHEALRGKAYNLDLSEIARRTREAWDRGATEICMQGGISPHYTGHTYLSLLRAAKDEVPGMHIHAFSPLEIMHGASTLDMDVRRYLGLLRDAGLGSLPGTAAEILDDDVRSVICPDKLSTREWLDVVAAAHEVGLRTTSTIMFGHIETPVHWARHLLALRDLQTLTGGFTEFVPLPFVHMEAPMSLRGESRIGPTWREVRLMHAVARLVLNPLITNIQASWVKLGETGVTELLFQGVNDFGGTLMNESISRAAGAPHGQELPPSRMEALICGAGRAPQQRTTLYQSVPQERMRASFEAPPLSEILQTPFRNERRAS
jgi:FO synthase